MKHLIFATALALVTANAQAQDVYNFYFQKTDHAGEMVQVKNGEPVAASKTSTVKSTDEAEAPAPVSAPASAPSAPVAPVLATTIAAPNSAQEKFKNWRIGFGLAAVTDHVRHMSSNAYGLTAGYSFNRYFAVEGQAMYGKGYVYGDDYSTTSVNGYAGALGAKLTPIHIDLFGWDLIDVAVNGGVMTTQGSEDDTANTATHLVPYVGAEVAVNVTRSLTLALDGKFENGDGKFGQMMFNGIVKF